MSVSRTAVTQREWEDLANLDPLFAILTDKSKQFGRWSREEFFASGQQEIDALKQQLAAIQAQLNQGSNLSNFFNWVPGQ